MNNLRGMGRSRVLTILSLFTVGGAVTLWLLIEFLAPRELNTNGLNAIQSGMTLAEVEAILGGPPGDYGDGPIVAEGSFEGSLEFCCGIWELNDPSVRTWTGQTMRICVRFDEVGQVRTRGWHEVSRDSDGRGSFIRRFYRTLPGWLRCS